MGEVAIGNDLLQPAQALGTALGAGLLVGLERGWRSRTLPEGTRVAGLRTFGLLGLLGGLLALLQPQAGLLLAAGLVAVTLLFFVSWPSAAQRADTVSITTAVAGLVTFALGALAGHGQLELAIAGAVVVALLLDLKEELHGGLRRIAPAELNALLQLGVLSAVILPLLPDAGYGPYQALNPYRLWLAVVLVAGLSLAGHFAIRLRGHRQGLLWAGLMGGLASSTAATLSLSRQARAAPQLAASAAAAIVASSGVMFLRMAVVVSALQPSLAVQLGGFLMLLGLLTLLLAGLEWRRSVGAAPAAGADKADVDAPSRPFDLPTALGFGLLLAVVAVLVPAAREALGDSGVFLLAFVSGLADVNAMVISSVTLHAHGALDVTATAAAILLAALANLLLKAGMAWRVAGRSVGQPVVLSFAAVIVIGGLLALRLGH